MYGDSRPARLSALPALASIALVAAAVGIPLLQDAPLPTTADVTATASLAVAAARLATRGQSRWAAALGAAALSWTLVGLAPLLPEGMETTVARLGLLPHALIVGSVLAMLQVAPAVQRFLTTGALGVAAVAGAGWPVPALAIFGTLIGAGLWRLRAPLSADHSLRTALGAVLAACFLALDPRVWGDLLSPGAVDAAVALTVAVAAAAIALLLPRDPSPWALGASAGDPSSLGAWLGELLGSTAITVTFPADEDTVDLAGKPKQTASDAGVVRDTEGSVVAYLAPDPQLDPTFAAPMSRMLASIGAVARLRSRQRDQAERVASSRSRLLVTADKETQALERQLERTVISRLETISRLLEGIEHDRALDERLAVVRTELRRHARGLDPLVGRTLGEALTALAEHGHVVVELGDWVRSGGAADSGQVADFGEVPDRVARTAWFIASEAVTNAVKHAPGAMVMLRAHRAESTLEVLVHDNGPGGVDRDGSGLRGLADRVAAVGGRFELVSGDMGSTVGCVLPITPSKGVPSSDRGVPRTRSTTSHF